MIDFLLIKINSKFERKKRIINVIKNEKEKKVHKRRKKFEKKTNLKDVSSQFRFHFSFLSLTREKTMRSILQAHMSGF